MATTLDNFVKLLGTDEYGLRIALADDEIGFATETKLEEVRILLNSLDGKDSSTETTLAALKTAFDNEGFASETKLETVRLLLNSLDGKDFATELTLDTRLSSLETKLDTLQTEAKASDAVTITPDDSTDLATVPTTGLYIGGNGDIKVDMLDGTTTTFVGIKAGVVYPFEITRVYATGTTATNIVVLY